jgi:predicted membrane-bound mannosyltransferase/DNA-binding beta-propeller fold protein YncE
MSEAVIPEKSSTDWLDKPLAAALNLNWEKTAYIVIIALAIFTRFWRLGDRVMSFDESEHVYYALDLYRGLGYQHTPLTHGPFLFHANALAYALFGVDDFTARIVPAIFGVLLVASPILLRTWLGKRGALLLAAFLLISPSILYHSRYIRNDVYMMLYGMLMIWGILSYFRDRKTRSLYALAAIAAMMYVTKEISFIYIAIFGVVVVVAGLYEIAREAGWGREGVGRTLAGLAIALGVLLIGIVAGARILELFKPVVPEGEIPGVTHILPSLVAIAVLAALVGFVAYLVMKQFMPEAARRSRAMAVAMILGGQALFMLSAGPLLLLNHEVGKQTEIVTEGSGPDNLQTPVEQVIPESGSTIWGLINGSGSLEPYIPTTFFAGGNFPIDEANTVNAVRAFFLLAIFGGFAMGLGLWWNARVWLIATGIFGAICIVLFTTIFTNGVGLFTGTIGSLGYWLAQQEVQRGSQPPGYYFLVLSIYEYLPMILSVIALVVFRFARLYVLPVTIWLLLVAFAPLPWSTGIRAIIFGLIIAALWLLLFRDELLSSIRRGMRGEFGEFDKSLTIPLLFVWMAGAWLAYSVSGEKMPWLMVHMALPMACIGAVWVSHWSRGIDWRGVLLRREWLALILIPILVIAALAVIGGLALFGSNSQSVAPSLVQLNAMGSVLGGLLVLGAAAAGLYVLSRRWGGLRPIKQMGTLAALGVLGILTLRTSWYYNYVNYDSALEFGVYAHGGPGLKIAYEQLKELSQRVTGAPNQLEVLFDAESAWPWRWYLRDFVNQRYITNEPSRSDASLPVLILQQNWDVVDRAVGNNYTYSEYHLIWWPMEDYKRVDDILRCPEVVTRRDGSTLRYAAYDENGDGQVDANEQANGDARCNQRNLGLLDSLWDIWFHRDYTSYAGLTGQTLTEKDWQHEKEFRMYVRKDLAAQVWDQAIGTLSVTGETVDGSTPDGDPYQANWRDIDALTTFGSPGVGDGQFTSPHGIAIAPDGSIYVADSNNHRVQKFDADGQFVLAFGTWSGEPPGSNFFNPEWAPPRGTFYEPWDVAVANDGSVYVADLWNSRIQKFDADGNFITMWGHFGESGGRAEGAQGTFFGPRGVAVDEQGRVFVTDTGNKRVQVFDSNGAFLFQFGGGGLLENNLDEPVGIDIGPDGQIVIADTWNGRIQVFTPDGEPLTRWDVNGWFDLLQPDQGRNNVGKPYLEVDDQGLVYVSDQAGTRILVFDLSGNYKSSFGLPGTSLRSFNAPSGIAIDRQGKVLLVDTGNSRVMVFAPVEVDAPPAQPNDGESDPQE